MQRTYDPEVAQRLMFEYRNLPRGNQAELELWKERAVAAGFKVDLPEEMARKISHVSEEDWEFSVPTGTF